MKESNGEASVVITCMSFIDNHRFAHVMLRCLIFKCPTLNRGSEERGRAKRACDITFKFVIYFCPLFEYPNLGFVEVWLVSRLRSQLISALFASDNYLVVLRDWNFSGN